MKPVQPPRDYPNWRAQDLDRAEDAAYLFGFYLMQHCRDEAMATLPKRATAKLKSAVEEAVDVALHNVCDMLEGFWQLDSGPAHTVTLKLVVEVRDSKGVVVEEQEISPEKLDLPIGYWKWAREREFR